MFRELLFKILNFFLFLLFWLWWLAWDDMLLHAAFACIMASLSPWRGLHALFAYGRHINRMEHNDNLGGWCPSFWILHGCPTLPPPAEGCQHGSALLFCLLVICSTTGRDTAFSGGGSGSPVPFGKEKNKTTQLPLDCNFAINPSPSAPLTSPHEVIIY